MNKILKHYPVKEEKKMIGFMKYTEKDFIERYKKICRLEKLKQIYDKD